MFIQNTKKEIGRYYQNYELIGFTNLCFKEFPDSRATHTPTILFKIDVDEEFNPIIDNLHTGFKWTRKLPERIGETLKYNKWDFHA